MNKGFGVDFNLQVCAGVRLHPVSPETSCVVLPVAQRFYIGAVDLRGDACSIESFEYNHVRYLPAFEHYPRVHEGPMPVCARVSVKENGEPRIHTVVFDIVGLARPLHLVPEHSRTYVEKMTEPKGPVSLPSYELFVETCDADRLCYPVVDGRVEVPVGARFRFAASCDVEGFKANVFSFVYQDTTSFDSAAVANNVYPAYLQLTIQDPSGKAYTKDVSVAVVPVYHYFALYDFRFRLVFRHGDRIFHLNSEGECVGVPLCSKYIIECPTEGYQIMYPLTYGRRNEQMYVNVRLLHKETKTEILQKVALTCSCCCCSAAAAASTPRKVPLCAEAKGSLGKRFVPPWDSSQRACEECFLTRVENPKGWTVVNGDDACNYEPLSVTLTCAKSDTPLIQDADGSFKVPYGTVLGHALTKGTVKSRVIDGQHLQKDVPLIFKPTRNHRRKKIVLHIEVGPQTIKRKFHLVPAESEEELERLFKRDELACSIASTEKITENLRESLRCTLEMLEANQAELVKLRVEEARLE